MKANIPNQSTGKRYIHDLSHDVNTTSDFGFLQPVLCREVEGNSNVHLSVHQLVRMMPMVYPTFGRLTLNTYSVFVPIESVYHPYGSLRAGQTYQGAGSTYIPDMVISGSAALFSLILKCLSGINVIEIGNGITYGGEYVMGDTANFSNLIVPASGSGLITTIMNLWKDKVSSFVFGAASDVPSTWYQYQTYLAKPGTSTTDPALLNTERYDWIDAINYQGNVYLVCGEYSIAARNIRKVGYGLGYKALWDNELLSFLPFFAYYKGWFDLFNPQRDITWKDTNAAGLQEWMEQYGKFNLLSDASSSVIKVRGQQLMDFFLDIAQCYYTASPDFVSVAITGQNVPTTPPEVRSVMSSESTMINSVGIRTGNNDGSPAIFNGSGAAPTTAVQSQVLTAQGINLLRAMYYRRNAHRVAGGDIEAFMKAMLGTEYKDEDDSFWIGSQRLDIAMTPVFSNADTAQGSGSGTWLGAFAGQGSGAHSDRNRPEEWHYTCKYDGYVLTYIALVPESRYAQGIDMNLKHVRKVDFFDPVYDSFSLAPTAKKYIYAEQQLDILDSPQDFGASFGNHPAYIEKCVAQNILNGDMSLRSTRATYLPFTLDKLLPYTQTEVDANAGATYITNFRSSLLVNGPIWRYIGLYPWIGNYGRIFENAGNADYQGAAVGNPIFYSKGYDDNNVIDNYISLKVSSYKLPVADSFQTGSLDGRDTMALNIS